MITPQTAAIIAEIETNLALGITPAAIINDLGTTSTALERRLLRAGRKDLAAAIRAPYIRPPGYHKHRGDTCADCRTVVTDGSTRCRPCDVKLRQKVA